MSGTVNGPLDDRNPPGGRRHDSGPVGIIAPMILRLNPEQDKAFEKIAKMKQSEVVLIEGPPGTGKTVLLAVCWLQLPSHSLKILSR